MRRSAGWCSSAHRWYHGVRFAITICLLVTVVGLVPALSERWFATLKPQKLELYVVAPLIFVGAVLLVVGLIHWLVSGDRRLAGALVPPGVTLSIVP